MTQYDEMGESSERPVDHRTVAEAVPDIFVAMPSVRGQAEDRARRELRARVASAGESLGFEVGSEGTWRSPTGVTIMTRTSERKLTPAAAVYFVTEIVRSARREGARTAVLFVVAHTETVESFMVAVRHRAVGDIVRTIAVKKLERLATMHLAGDITHEDAVVILAPVSGIDAGHMVDLIGKAHTGRVE